MIEYNSIDINRKCLMYMKLYFAPLEGITTYVFRNTHNAVFGECDCYYTPFVSPSDNEKIGRKGFRDILPENNAGTNVKVQVLTNNSESFVKFSEKIKEYGYDEVNINLGCPSATVVGKMRGSGFLRDTDALKTFFDEIFEKSDIKISVKTRAGFSSPDEIKPLTELYNNYPLSLLIVHPRTRNDFYKGAISDDAFQSAYNTTKHPLVYNGNVFTKKDYDTILERYPDLHGVMLGRGAVANPALFREIRGGAPLGTDELLHFSQELIKNYNGVLKSDTFTLNKMKEIWLHFMWNYPQEKKILKAVKKANKLSDLVSATNKLLLTDYSS